MEVKQEVKVENPEEAIFDNSSDNECENYERLHFLLKTVEDEEGGYILCLKQE